MVNPINITYNGIFKFWMPLVATWLMMAFEGPYLSSLIARMPDPKYNLAAYGAAFAFALIIEAPIIMIMSASTKLVRDSQSLDKLRKFTWILNFSITAAMLILIIPPVFDFIALDLVNLPPRVAQLTYYATVILIPWPGSIGYRRFYQGILISNGKPQRVTYGTILRLAAMSVTALVLFLIGDIPGVVVGASALSIGVVTEGFASRIMAKKGTDALEKIKNNPDKRKPLSYKGIFNFYYPLALTAVVGLGVQPIVTFFMGQSFMPLESLAVFPVVSNFVFFFRAIGLSFHEAAIALLGDNFEGYTKLRNFGFYSGIIIFTALGILAFTPISNFIFGYIFGLEPDLVKLTKLPVVIMSFIPPLTLLISFQRAVLINDDNTKPVSNATVTEVAGIVIVLLIFINFTHVFGAVAAAIAFMIGRLAANGYLVLPFNKSLRRGYQ